MTKLNIHEAKTHLSRYLAKVQAGEEIILCKNGQPIAQIVPLPQSKKRRLFGAAQGKVKIDSRFFEALTEKELPGFGL